MRLLRTFLFFLMASTMAFAQSSVNIFNSSTVTASSYISTTDGTVQAASAGYTQYGVTDFMNVQPGQNIVANGNLLQAHIGGVGVAFYDKNKAFISADDTYPNPTWTIPSTGYYMRATVVTANASTIMIGLSPLPGTYTAFSNPPDYGAAANGGSTTGPSVNIFNSSAVSSSAYIQTSDGSQAIATVGYTQYGTTGFMNVQPGQVIASNGALQSAVIGGVGVGFYDKNKAYLSGDATNATAWTIPANGYYMRATILTANSSTIMIGLSPLPSSYTAFSNPPDYGAAAGGSTPIPPTYSTVIDFDGDSLTNGAGDVTSGSIQTTRASTVINGLGSTITTGTNTGVSGQTLLQMIARIPTNVDPVYQSGKANYVIAQGGHNDIAQGALATDVESRIQTYVTALLASHPDRKIVWVTEGPAAYGVNPSAFLGIRNAVNTYMRANFKTMGIYALSDFAKDAIVGQDGEQTNSTYYTGDQIHPNPTGYARWGFYDLVSLQNPPPAGGSSVVTTPNPNLPGAIKISQEFTATAQSYIFPVPAGTTAVTATSTGLGLATYLITGSSDGGTTYRYLSQKTANGLVSTPLDLTGLTQLKIQTVGPFVASRMLLTIH